MDLKSLDKGKVVVMGERIFREYLVEKKLELDGILTNPLSRALAQQPFALSLPLLFPSPIASVFSSLNLSKTLHYCDSILLFYPSA